MRSEGLLLGLLFGLTSLVASLAHVDQKVFATKPTSSLPASSLSSAFAAASPSSSAASLASSAAAPTLSANAILSEDSLAIAKGAKQLRHESKKKQKKKKKKKHKKKVVLANVIEEEEEESDEEAVEEGMEEVEEEDVEEVIDGLMRAESPHRKSVLATDKYDEHEEEEEEDDDEEEEEEEVAVKHRKVLLRRKTPKRRVCAKGDAICIPSNYSKFDLPNETQTLVHVGIDIKDIPKIDDQEYSITLNAFFVVRWSDERMIIDQAKMDRILKKGEDPDSWIPVDVSFIKEFWLPDAEILNLKEFKTLDVLSKLEGLWLNRQFEIMYAVATRITFICPMTFNSFPLDIQVCRFQVGSFNYDVNKMIFRDEFIADEKQIRSVLDYFIEINPLSDRHKRYEALTGNYSVAGFELTLRRKVSHYIITYYLPSGMFVVVSWISFLVPPAVVPGRMTLLVTVFLVLVNIFNTITTNIPKAEGLTAIEAWVIVCVLFVFGALIEYAGLLLKMKLATTRRTARAAAIAGSGASGGGASGNNNANNTANNRDNGSTGGVDSRENSFMLNGTMAEDKRIMRGFSRRRQQEDISHARLDILFLMLFPLFFLFFNLVYWLSFLYGTCSNCDSPVYSAGGVPQSCAPEPAAPAASQQQQDQVHPVSPGLEEQGFLV